MTVAELIEKLKEKDPNAEICTIRAVNTDEWERTSEPKVSSHKNSFANTVFID